MPEPSNTTCLAYAKSLLVRPFSTNTRVCANEHAKLKAIFGTHILEIRRFAHARQDVKTVLLSKSSKRFAQFSAAKLAGSITSERQFAHVSEEYAWFCSLPKSNQNSLRFIKMSERWGRDLYLESSQERILCNRQSDGLRKCYVYSEKSVLQCNNSCISVILM